MKKAIVLGATILAISLVVVLCYNYIAAQGVEIRNARVQIRGGSPTRNQFNGSAHLTATDGQYYTQALGGVDDYNDNKGYPSDSYEGSWTNCAEGNNWCGTGDSNATQKDNQTGLVWSGNLVAAAARDWFWANNCISPEEEGNPGYPGGTCVSHGDDACACVKRTTGKTGCDDLGDGGWRLPYQKELMQAYINGSWKNLTSAGYGYWSSTTRSSGTHYAWVVYLSNGSTYGDLETNTASYRVRCVR